MQLHWLNQLRKFGAGLCLPTIGKPVWKPSFLQFLLVTLVVQKSHASAIKLWNHHPSGWWKVTHLCLFLFVPRRNILLVSTKLWKSNFWAIAPSSGKSPLYTACTVQWLWVEDGICKSAGSNQPRTSMFGHRCESDRSSVSSQVVTYFCCQAQWMSAMSLIHKAPLASANVFLLQIPATGVNLFLKFLAQRPNIPQQTQEF